MQRHADDGARSLLDVRRVSAFDLAAATGTAVRLSEHFRSSPHLIEFPLAAFYGEEVSIMTTNPATETADCIDVHRIDVHRIGAHDIGGRHIGGDAVDDWRNGGDPLDLEATEAVRLVDSMVADGLTDIGVISPFRAHAERIENLLADHFDIDRSAGSDCGPERCTPSRVPNATRW